MSVFLFFYVTSSSLKESKRELKFELKGLEKKIFVLLAFICLFFSSRFIGRLFF